MRKLLNPLFIFHLLIIAAVLLGVIPREVIIFQTLLLLIYFILAPIEDSVIFFIRSIPLFIAIPLTASYDNLNMWRVMSIVIFLKWLTLKGTWHYLGSGLIVLLKRPKNFVKEHSWLIVLFSLLILAFFSLTQAVDSMAGVKRIIYFINAALVGIVIAYPPKGREFINRIIKNLVVPVLIVSLVGVIQVVSTYFIDIYQFMRLWGEEIQLRLFGSVWSYIAVNVGNTWFAYFGDQLSLRVFSLFPDSHSFPIFLLLGLPAFFAWSVLKPLQKSSLGLKEMFHTRAKLSVLWIPLIFLLMILSGTRGIWAAGIGMLVWVPIVIFYFKFVQVDRAKVNTFKYLSSYIVLFFMLFAVAYPIFSSPQFLVSKGDTHLLERRLRSILDFGETSNSQRIEIWSKTINSIKDRPLIGIGIYNFPVILDQEIYLGKAGSSAHNIYLHIAAEMGLIALAAFITFCVLILSALIKQFARSKDLLQETYTAGLILTIPWVLAYLMTDIAIFDERALLISVVTLGIVASSHTNHV